MAEEEWAQFDDFDNDANEAGEMDADDDQWASFGEDVKGPDEPEKAKPEASASKGETSRAENSQPGPTSQISSIPPQNSTGDNSNNVKTAQLEPVPQPQEEKGDDTATMDDSKTDAPTEAKKVEEEPVQVSNDDEWGFEAEFDDDAGGNQADKGGNENEGWDDFGEDAGPTSPQPTENAAVVTGNTEDDPALHEGQSKNETGQTESPTDFEGAWDQFDGDAGNSEKTEQKQGANSTSESQDAGNDKKDTVKSSDNQGSAGDAESDVDRFDKEKLEAASPKDSKRQVNIDENAESLTSNLGDPQNSPEATDISRDIDREFIHVTPTEAQSLPDSHPSMKDDLSQNETIAAKVDFETNVAAPTTSSETHDLQGQDDLKMNEKDWPEDNGDSNVKVGEESGGDPAEKQNEIADPEINTGGEGKEDKEQKMGGKEQDINLEGDDSKLEEHLGNADAAADSKDGKEYERNDTEAKADTGTIPIVEADNGASDFDSVFESAMKLDALATTQNDSSGSPKGLTTSSGPAQSTAPSPADQVSEETTKLEDSNEGKDETQKGSLESNEQSQKDSDVEFPGEQEHRVDLNNTSDQKTLNGATYARTDSTQEEKEEKVEQINDDQFVDIMEAAPSEGGQIDESSMSDSKQTEADQGVENQGVSSIGRTATVESSAGKHDNSQGEQNPDSANKDDEAAPSAAANSVETSVQNVSLKPSTEEADWEFDDQEESATPAAQAGATQLDEMEKAGDEDWGFEEDGAGATGTPAVTDSEEKTGEDGELKKTEETGGAAAVNADEITQSVELGAAEEEAISDTQGNKALGFDDSPTAAAAGSAEKKEGTRESKKGNETEASGQEDAKQSDRSEGRDDWGFEDQQSGTPAADHSQVSVEGEGEDAGWGFKENDGVTTDEGKNENEGWDDFAEDTSKEQKTAASAEEDFDDAGWNNFEEKTIGTDHGAGKEVKENVEQKSADVPESTATDEAWDDFDNFGDEKEGQQEGKAAQNVEVSASDISTKDADEGGWDDFKDVQDTKVSEEASRGVGSLQHPGSNSNLVMKIWRSSEKERLPAIEEYLQDALGGNIGDGTEDTGIDETSLAEVLDFLESSRFVSTILGRASPELQVPPQERWHGSEMQRILQDSLRLPMPPPPQSKTLTFKVVESRRRKMSRQSAKDTSVVNVLGIDIAENPGAAASPKGSVPEFDMGNFSGTSEAEKTFDNIRNEIQNLLLGLPDLKFMLLRTSGDEPEADSSSLAM